MVKGAADIADDDPLDVAIEKLRECCPAEAVADLLGLASGVLEAVHGERSQQEISWAAREWAQLMSQTQPMILVFEDIHWAEEPLLELIEHMTEWVRDGPLMILCLARPELLDVSSDWGGGRLRATSIELEPLGEADSETLIEALSEDGTVSPETRRALLEKTGGNPLFLEEVMLVVAECGEEEAAAAGIPDTIQALIAARIDRLEGPSKAVLQRASVIGRTFWAGAIQYLADGENMDDAIDDLLLRDLVVGESRSSLSNETAYRFKHVLIRDVAYASLTKSARAAHHARFAEWLRERAGDELLEIRAYHLDHAASLLAELDGAPPADLARGAAEALEEAGRRALAREGNQAARHSFLRSVELEPTLARRYLAAKAAWRLDDLPAVAREMEAVRAEAVRVGNENIEGKALTGLADMVLMREADPLRARELAEQALALIEDDPPARFDALRVAWNAAYWVGHLSDAEHYVLEQLELARAEGRKDLESIAILTWADTFWAKLDLETARQKLEQAREPGRGERRDQRPGPGPDLLGEALPPGGRPGAGRGGVRGSGPSLRGSRSSLGSGAIAQLGRMGLMEERRSREGGEALPRVDPPPEADRRPGDALREPARLRRAPARARPDRGSRALRPRRTRDGRPARRDLSCDHGRDTGPGTGRAGS